MTQIIDKLAQFKNSGWKFQEKHLSPHDGALGNESMVQVASGDEAITVIATHQKL